MSKSVPFLYLPFGFFIAAVAAFTGSLTKAAFAVSDPNQIPFSSRDLKELFLSTGKSIPKTLAGLPKSCHQLSAVMLRTQI
jgi:hypothetical protein